MLTDPVAELMLDAKEPQATVREVGRVDLGEALELTALIAQHDRPRSRRVAARWLQRWLDEAPAPTFEDVALVVGCLAALGARSLTR